MGAAADAYVAASVAACCLQFTQRLVVVVVFAAVDFSRFCFIFRQKFPWSLNSLMQRPSIAIANKIRRRRRREFQLKSFFFLGFCFAFHIYFRISCFVLFLFGEGVNRY